MDDDRAYWPSGVKLDSRIILVDGVALRHEVTWYLQWDDVSVFHTPDYYAHDLYLLQDNGTFLDPNSLRLVGTLPQIDRYRTDNGARRLRLGWATYRPTAIQANTLYTVTFASDPTTTTIDPFVEDFETYGVRLPPSCIGSCLWFPISWCSIAPGGATLRLFNNSHPDGILPLGIPQGGCNTLLFLPMVIANPLP